MTGSGFDKIAVMIIMAIIIPVAALFISWLFQTITGLVSPTEGKSRTYECGMDPKGPGNLQFNVRYYVYALIFVIFDVEVIFLYPWAVAFKNLGIFALIEMFIFLIILIFGFIYAWRKGALEWR